MSTDQTTTPENPLELLEQLPDPSDRDFWLCFKRIFTAPELDLPHLHKALLFCADNDHFKCSIERNPTNRVILYVTWQIFCAGFRPSILNIARERGYIFGEEDDEIKPEDFLNIVPEDNDGQTFAILADTVKEAIKAKIDGQINLVIKIHTPEFIDSYILNLLHYALNDINDPQCLSRALRLYSQAIGPNVECEEFYSIIEDLFRQGYRANIINVAMRHTLLENWWYDLLELSNSPTDCAKDVEQFMEIVGYCILSDDQRILEEILIPAVEQGIGETTTTDSSPTEA